VASWSEDEQCNKEGQDKTNVDRETVHRDNDTATSKQKAAHLKCIQTMNFNDMEPFSNFQGLSHNIHSSRKCQRRFFQFVCRYIFLQDGNRRN